MRSPDQRPQEAASGDRVAGPAVGFVLQQTRLRLEAAGIPTDEAAVEARLLVGDVLDLSSAQLYARLREPVSLAAASALEALVQRRLQREPLAYIRGRREFFGLELRVDRRVLIPRPETELVVEAGIRIVTSLGTSAPVLVDVGTGSGAIAIALARALPSATVVATDRSIEALQVARTNVELHGVAERVSLVAGDLLEPVRGPFDLIVANLPYVPESELDRLAPEVREFEPRIALSSGPDGFALYRRLLAQLPSRLRRPGGLVIEIGIGQADLARELVQSAMPNAHVEVIVDYAGISRVVAATLR